MVKNMNIYKYTFVFAIFLIGIKIVCCQSGVMPIEGAFEVMWADTIKLKDGQGGEPMVNGKLIIPPYGNDGCFLAETGQKLYYTFSPHQKIIRENCSSRYIHFKTERHNIIFNIETGKEVYDAFYKEIKGQVRNPYIPKNRIIESRYVCFASSQTTFTCVDTVTMKEIWTFISETEIYDDYVENNGVVYVGSKEYLFAIDLETGNRKWQAKVGEISSNLIVNDDVIYCLIKAKGIVAVNISNGKLKYTSDRIGLFVGTKKLTAIGDTLFFIDSGIYLFDCKTGKWIYSSEEIHTCSSKEIYFIHRGNVFLQVCDRSNSYYGLKSFNMYNGKTTYDVTKESPNTLYHQFLNSANFFSPLLGNMIFSTSIGEIKDGFWIAKIYGVKVKDDL